jgi:leucyl/phenylalanyl-tRNA--protein transferase
VPADEPPDGPERPAALTARLDPPGPSWWDTLPLATAPGDAPVVLGGSPTAAMLLGAYRAGVFPWPISDDLAAAALAEFALGPDGGDAAARVTGARLRRARRSRPRIGLPWWSPDPRAVIPAGSVHASGTLRRRMRSCGWTTTLDTRFDEVVNRCRRTGTDVWITDELRAGYAELHALGWAHSLEVWDGDGLAGGVFGILVGGVFVGESMFHARTDASKVALADLDSRFTAGGGRLIEVQFVTDHLRALGALAIPRADYLAILRAVRDEDVRLVTDRLPVARLAPAGTGRARSR